MTLAVRLRLALAAGMALGTMALSTVSASAQDKHEFSGQLLTNQQGELCTMCEADVSCAAEPPAPSAETNEAVPGENVVSGVTVPTVTLHFQKRDFVGQMLTVLDYFPFTRKFGLSHTRAVDIAQDGGPPTEGAATFNLETKRIDIQSAAGAPLFWIDRADGTWRSNDGAVRGICTRLK